VQHALAALEDVDAIRDLQRAANVLLHEQHADANIEGVRGDEDYVFPGSAVAEIELARSPV
jgi:hypothetical protein